MKCDTCINQTTYTTGVDEYPQCTTMLVCSKFHWEGNPEIEKKGDSTVWDDCKDYKKKPSSKQP